MPRTTIKAGSKGRPKEKEEAHENRYRCSCAAVCVCVLTVGVVSADPWYQGPSMSQYERDIASGAQSDAHADSRTGTDADR